MSKWFATLLLCCVMPAWSFDSDVIWENQAMDYLNQDVTMCGRVKQVNSTQNTTYLNLGGIYPNHKSSFAIRKEYTAIFLNKFGDWSILQNKKVCAKGIIVQDRKGRPRINLDNPHLLRFVK